MCVLYVSFASKVRPRTSGCDAMGSAVWFILRSRLLLYSARSGVNRVQVVLSGFSVRLFCFVQAKTLCRYGCMYLLAALVLVCVDVMVMSKDVRTVKTTTVTDVRIGVINVQSLGNKLDCVIDHITDNRIDIVGITETWLSNDDKNNMSVVNTCLNNGYTLLHRPRNTGRRGGGVGVLINNQINVKSRMIGVNPEITSFESMEVVITAGSITIRLSVIYRMPPVKSKNGLKQGTFCNEFNDYLEKLSCMNGNIVIVGDFNILDLFKIYVQKQTEAIIY